MIRHSIEYDSIVLKWYKARIRNINSKIRRFLGIESISRVHYETWKKLFKNC